MARDKHGFVYGLGLIYTDSFEWANGSTFLSLINGSGQGRIAEHVFALQPRMGYEARFRSGWFLRPLWTFDLPFSTGTVWTADNGEKGSRYPHDPITFMYMTITVTVGYAYRLASKSTARILRAAAPHRGGF